MNSIEEQLFPYVEQLHDQMRKMYGIPPASMGSPAKLKKVKKEMYVGPFPEEVLHPNLQSAFDFALGESAKGKSTTVNVRGVHESVVIPAFAVKEKELLSKPHPKGCICADHKREREMSVIPVLRIGDAERNETLALLDERLASGHITLAEFSARADGALAATMKSDLDALVRDLPAVEKKIMKETAKQEDIYVPYLGRSVTTFILSAGSCVLPVLAGIGLMEGGERIGLVVLLALAAMASLIMTVLRN